MFPPLCPGSMPTILPLSGGCARWGGGAGGVAGAVGAVASAAGGGACAAGAVGGAVGALPADGTSVYALADLLPFAAVTAMPTVTVTIVAARTRTALRRERIGTSASVVRRVSGKGADHDLSDLPQDGTGSRDVRFPLESAPARWHRGNRD